MPKEMKRTKRLGKPGTATDSTAFSHGFRGFAGFGQQAQVADSNAVPEVQWESSVRKLREVACLCFRCFLKFGGYVWFFLKMFEVVTKREMGDDFLLMLLWKHEAMQQMMQQMQEQIEQLRIQMETLGETLPNMPIQTL